MTDDPGKRLREEIYAHAEERRQMFVVGFARFCMERGLQTQAPSAHGNKAETWWDVGRRLYGRELFDATLAIEVEKARAEKRVPAVRSHKG